MSAFINQAAACAGDHAPRSAAQEARRGLRASLPVLLGFIPFALVLGAQATQKGLSVMEVPLMTGLNFGVAQSSPPSGCGRRRRICC